MLYAEWGIDLSISKKTSIIGLIKLFFVAVFLLVNLLFLVAGEYLHGQKLQDERERFLAAHRLLMGGHTDIGVLGVRVVQKPIYDLAELAEVLDESPFGKIVLYEDRVFFLHNRPLPPPPHMHEFAFEHHRPLPPPLLEDVRHKESGYFAFAVTFVDVLLILFFLFLMKKLLPLRELKESVDRFGNGDKLLDIVIVSDDEVASIAKSFNVVLEKIASMREARGLFLRNILHELKTPIMKGLMLCDAIEPDAKRLKLIFFKMNYLLDEVVKMERFSSGEWALNRRSYRVVDILDHARDILLCEKESFDLIVSDDSPVLFVDFELFAVALKNLIDNAFKYSSTRPKVLVSTSSITVCSHGDRLDEKMLDFTKAFNREYENSMQGLGLGLYVTNAITQKHGFVLKYAFVDGQNCFEICALEA